MFRRMIAPVAALIIVLLASACTSTTVIGEGRLGTPDDATDTAASVTPDRASSADDNTDASADRGERTDPVTDQDDASPLTLADEALVSAWTQECLDGSDLACDVLFTLTERGSDAETIARTCGGRSEVEVRFCTPDIEPFQDRLWFDAESAGLPDVVEDCRAGDLISCDFLYFRSEVGSTYEELGTTCGDRVAIATPDCRSALGG